MAAVVKFCIRLLERTHKLGRSIILLLHYTHSVPQSIEHRCSLSLSVEHLLYEIPVFNQLSFRVWLRVAVVLEHFYGCSNEFLSTVLHKYVILRVAVVSEHFYGNNLDSYLKLAPVSHALEWM